LIAGVDLGSTSVKGCLFDLDSLEVADQRALDCPLRHPRPGWAEHDLGAIEKALITVLEVAPRGTTVGLASAMHALVLLDRRGCPLGNAISWADDRAGTQALELKALDPTAHQRTGTPLHPMAWPAKLRWAQEQSWWKEVRRLTDLKSYLWERITGERAPLDRSSASATGLSNWRAGDWDDKLCSLLNLDGLLPAVASSHRTPWQGRDLRLGGADGPLGNLGLGAVQEGQIAISLGTSGAIRQFTANPVEVPSALFLYALDDLGWVQGGAISNGGSVLDWLEQRSGLSPEAIFEQASQSEIGAGGLRVYPYFQGERAPFWRPGVVPHIVGTINGFPDLARATLEGVAFCLRRLLGLLPSSQGPLRCTGGMFASPAWRSLFANVIGKPISWGAATEATALGAALLTQPDALSRSRALPLGESLLPDPTAAGVYDTLFEQWQKGDPTDISPRSHVGE
jgi:gluconokinase